MDVTSAIRYLPFEAYTPVLLRDSRYIQPSISGLREYDGIHNNTPAIEDAQQYAHAAVTHPCVSVTRIPFDPPTPHASMAARRAVAAARLTQFRSSRLVKSNGPPPFPRNTTPPVYARVYVRKCVCVCVYANALSVLSADPARLRITRGLSGASWPGRGLNYGGRRAEVLNVIQEWSGNMGVSA